MPSNIKKKPSVVSTDNFDSNEKTSTKYETENNSLIDKETSGKPNAKIKKLSTKSIEELSSKTSDEFIENGSPIKEDNESPEKVTEKEFDPTKKNYHPIKDAFWNHGQS